ncbi:sunset domain-containing protein [Nocardioides sp. CF8]|uniref:sunset domain-containing protein n=1 Tax=Nocardioides sp. CF8 TaxID=110319 RepID=UPI000419F5D1
MGWLLGENWLWLLLSFLLGLGITLFLILRKVEVSTVSSKTTYAAAGTGAAAAGVGAASLAGSKTKAPSTPKATSTPKAQSTSFGSSRVEEPSTPAATPVGAHVADPVVESAPVYDEVEATQARDTSWTDTSSNGSRSSDSLSGGTVAGGAGAVAGGAVAGGAVAGGSAALADEDGATQARGFAGTGGTTSSFGAGSLVPAADGSSPDPAYTIKGNEDSMLFHPPASPYYGRTRAEVWFDSEDRARSAGFTRWDEKDNTSKVAGFASLPAAGAFGEGSADPLADGASPHESFTIKGNADSMLFHTAESPYYGRTRAEVWFDSEDRARAAGFTRWDQR